MDTHRRLAWLSQFDRFRVTTHGDNPWTDEALNNVIMHESEYDFVINTIGRLSSGYRCQRINALLPNSSPTSRHVLGLALDIIPDKDDWRTTEAAAQHLWVLALQGNLGLVQQIIIEPTWVHIGWYTATEPDKGMNLLRNIGPRQYAHVDAQ